jgi:ribosomal protein S18 acetylase RimI-like enzyme
VGRTRENPENPVPVRPKRSPLVHAAARAYGAAQRVFTLDITRLILLEALRVRPPDIDPRYGFRFLAVDDLERLVDDSTNLLTHEFLERLSSGRDHCFAAFDGPRPVSYVWIAEGSIEAEHNRGRVPASGVAASFDDDAGFVYHAYTLPEYRGRRLSPACLAMALRRLAPRGITRLWTTTDWSNESFRAACRRLGAVELGTIWCMGWGDSVLKIVPRRAAPAGIRLGKRAVVERRMNRRPQPLQA